jgi:hypothetical protein|nr:MAG TPA: vesicle-associated membrane protein 2 [Caudoviricetes sp.]
MDDLSSIQKGAIKVAKSLRFPKVHTPFEDIPNIDEVLKQKQNDMQARAQDLSTFRVADTFKPTPLDEQLRISELLNVLKEQARVLKAQNEAFKDYVADARKETWFSRRVSIASVFIALASLLVAVLTAIFK